MYDFHEDVELTTGVVVRCRPVPPYALGPVFASLPAPPAPKVTIPSAAGGSETHTALRDSPEWDEFQRQMGEYNRRKKQAITDFHLDYGILGWWFPSDDAQFDEDDELTDEPPGDWKLPSIMYRYGAEPAVDLDDRRLQFIKFGLILTDEDADRIDNVLNAKQSVTKEDIKAALDPFKSSGDTANSQ